MPDDSREIAERLIAEMTPEQRRSLLHAITGGAGVSGDVTGGAGVPDDPASDAPELTSLFAGPFPDMFENPDPEVAPVPEVTRRFRVRLDLQRTTPPVWRRVELPGDITLDRLHLVIQAAMGWTDSHLHHFRTGADRRSAYFLNRFDIESEGEEGVDEADVRLDQLVVAKGDKLWYEYDFGDDWDHVLAVEAVLDDPPAKPLLVTGKRACPPEDCGGVWGYSELAAWVRSGYDEASVPDPFENAEDARSWLGPDWHPDHFDIAEMQQLLDQHLAEQIPLPDELLDIQRTLEWRGSTELSDLLAKAVDLHRVDTASEEGSSDRSATAGQPVQHDQPEPDRNRAEPTEAQAAAAVAPLMSVLEAVGSGVKLTSAGYLPPVVVTELAVRSGIAEWWIGKVNREDLTYPVQQLRAAARALGVVSVRKGLLAPTAAARRCHGDPLALWRHVATRLPMGRTDFDRQSGWVSLAVVAGGIAPAEWDDAVRSILTAIGWRSMYEGREMQLRVDNPTLDALETLTGMTTTRRSDPDAVAATAMAARAAIFGRRSSG